MAGTVKGGKQAAVTNKLLYGANFYTIIGRKGGLKSRGGGFAKIPGLAQRAGAIGGKAARRKHFSVPDLELSELRQLREQGWTIAELAERYGVTQDTILGSLEREVS